MLDTIATGFNFMHFVRSESSAMHEGPAKTGSDSNSASEVNAEESEAIHNRLASTRALAVRKIVAGLVAELLETLYADLEREEDELKDAAVPLRWHKRLMKELYFNQPSYEAATDSDMISRATSTSSNHIRPCLVGPVGERPIHVCFLRAGHFPDIPGFKEGVLDGIEMFDARQVVQGEIDRSYGKDYCAAIGDMVHGLCLQKRDYSENLALFLQRLSLGDPDSMSDCNAENKFEFEQASTGALPPFWLDLLAWARGAISEAGKRSDSGTMSDLKTLTTSGLYEGETPLFMVIADKNPTMVKRLLEEFKARCFALRRLGEETFSPCCRDQL